MAAIASLLATTSLLAQNKRIYCTAPETRTLKGVSRAVFLWKLGRGTPSLPFLESTGCQYSLASCPSPKPVRQHLPLSFCFCCCTAFILITSRLSPSHLPGWGPFDDWSTEIIQDNLPTSGFWGQSHWLLQIPKIQMWLSLRGYIILPTTGQKDS